MTSATSEPTSPPAQEVKKPETDHKKIKIGDILAFIDYTKVTSVLNGGRDLQVQSLATKISGYAVHGLELVETALTADQFTKEEKLPKTKLTEVLQNAGHRPFTVVFTKADGTERTLRGRWLSNEFSNQGYTLVEDLDVPEDKTAKRSNRIRQVDNREIKSIIIGGTKYSLKEK